MVEAWRPRFHVTPAGGKLMAPHGVVTYDGRLHVFLPMTSAFRRKTHASAGGTPALW